MERTVSGPPRTWPPGIPTAAPPSVRPAVRPGARSSGSRAWPCTCGGEVTFSAAALAAYRAGLVGGVTAEQGAHNWSPLHVAWRREREDGWGWDGYERRRDLLASATDGKLPSVARESGRDDLAIPARPPR